MLFGLEVDKASIPIALMISRRVEAARQSTRNILLKEEGMSSIRLSLACDIYESQEMYFNELNPVWQPIDDELCVDEESPNTPEYKEVRYTDDEIPFGGE